MTLHKTIIFDLSEVLISGLVGLQKPLSSRLKIDACRVLPVLGGESLNKLCKGEISEITYWTDVLQRSGWEISIDELSFMARRVFHGTVDHMPELVSDLAKQHQLVLFSDNGKEWFEYIKSIHPFLSSFETEFISCYEGKTKKQMETFEELVKCLNLVKDNCVFIDDLDENIKRATTVGIKSILFESHETLQVRLINDKLL